MGIILVKGHEEDSPDELTLTVKEAEVLSRELKIQAEEAMDHKTIHYVSLMLLNSRQFNLKINPHIIEEHPSKRKKE